MACTSRSTASGVVISGSVSTPARHDAVTIVATEVGRVCGTERDVGGDARCPRHRQGGRMIRIAAFGDCHVGVDTLWAPGAAPGTRERTRRRAAPGRGPHEGRRPGRGRMLVRSSRGRLPMSPCSAITTTSRRGRRRDRRARRGGVHVLEGDATCEVTGRRRHRGAKGFGGGFAERAAATSASPR